MKKKIMFFITGLDKGGAEVMLLKLLPRLKVKYEIILVSVLKKDDVGKQIAQKGLNVVYLNEKGFNLLRSIFKFRKLIKQFKPDLLFTFLIHADVFGRVFGKMFGVKKVYCSIRNDYSKVTKFYLFDRWTRFLVDKYVPNSSSLNGYLEDEVGVKKEKVFVIPNAIDLDEINNSLQKEFNLKKEFGIAKNRKVLVSVARFKKQKDFPTLIRAVHILKNKYKQKISLVLVGYGDEEKNLKDLINELDLVDDVIMPGSCFDTRLSIVKQADVFVLPSLTEGMSNSLLESMSLNTVSVVSNIKQNTVLIRNKINGLTFRVGESKDLAKKINLLINDAKLRERFEKEAYMDIEENYDINVIVKQFEKLIG